MNTQPFGDVLKLQCREGNAIGIVESRACSILCREGVLVYHETQTRLEDIRATRRQHIAEEIVHRELRQANGRCPPAVPPPEAGHYIAHADEILITTVWHADRAFCA